MPVERPIYTALPGLAAHLPCADFAALPTPLQVREFAGRALLIKRDDLSHPGYGGNKVRKLEFILAAAQQAGQRKLVTFGATGTHHGLATALFCRDLGLRCELLLFDQPDSEHVRANRSRLLQAGADCVDCGSLVNTLRRFYVHPGRLRRDTLFLFAGGSGVHGTLAFVNAALEFAAQLQQQSQPAPERLYVACSSGSTLAGLTLGMALAGLDTQVIGVQVADSRLGPLPACTAGTVKQLADKTLRWLERRGVAWPVSPVEITLNQAFLGPGYGYATREGELARQAFEQQMGIPLDGTYTAKAFAAVLADEQPGSCAYWHTLSSVSGST